MEQAHLRPERPKPRLMRIYVQNPLPNQLSCQPPTAGEYSMDDPQESRRRSRSIYKPYRVPKMPYFLAPVDSVFMYRREQPEIQCLAPFELFKLPRALGAHMENWGGIHIRQPQTSITPNHEMDYPLQALLASRIKEHIRRLNGKQRRGSPT